MRRLIPLGLAAIAFSSQALTAKEPGFVVAMNGADSNPGTLERPFRSIQHCASIVTAGQHCLIRAGTYRETVRPAQSGSSTAPISFKAFGDGPVLISGADLVNGFAAEGGKRFKTRLAWDLGEGKNQVFLNGKMLLEARFPNATNLFDPNNFGKFINPRGAKTVWTVDANGLPKANLAGAKINLLPGPEWVMETGTVRSSGAGSFSFDSPAGQMNERPDFAPRLYEPRNGNPYFLWGKLEFLDANNEWFLHNGTLYLGQNPAQNPAGKTLEVKRREFAFDLRDRSFVTVQGMQIFAASITTGNPDKPQTSNSSNIVLDDIHLRYQSHFTAIRPIAQRASWAIGLDSGLILIGKNHSLENSSIAFSAGNGVLLGGTGHTIKNNVIHNVDYAMTDAAAVFTNPDDSPSSGHLIEHNTMFNAGRSMIVHRKTKNLKILHNHLFNAGLLTNDLGMTYAYETDGAGSEIAYNLVHDNFAPSESMGLYLDNFSSNFVVHHNVVYNVRNAMNLNLPSINNRIFNNTFIGWHEAVGGGASRLSECDASGTLVSNNIFSGALNFGGIFDGSRCPSAKANPGLERNLELGPGEKRDPKFVNLIENDYALGNGSAAIDAGQKLEPFTDGFRGAAPDVGALEVGAKLDAGASLKLPCVYGDDCNQKPEPRYGILGEYFTDENLQQPATARIEPNLNLDLAEMNLPNMPKEQWSARFQTKLEVAKTGTHTFWLTADDGARLWLNGKQRVDRWQYKDPPEDSFRLELKAGQRLALKLELRQGSGGAGLKLEWAYPGQTRQIVPRRQFLRE
jgi:PA14 domain/Right handed beta helix region